MNKSEVSRNKEKITDQENINVRGFSKQDKKTDVTKSTAKDVQSFREEQKTQKLERKKQEQERKEQEQERKEQEQKRKKQELREVPFESLAMEIYSNRADVLPQTKDESSFHSSVRVVLHALGQTVPETIIRRKDPDYRHANVNRLDTPLQRYGTETLKKYLEPDEAPVETSKQNPSRRTKLYEKAKNLLPPRESDGPFKCTYVDEKRSAEQLNEALAKGPVIYDINETRSQSSNRHITVLDHWNGDITYADEGKLYRVPDRHFFKNDYQQYGKHVLLEAKHAFPTWKAYQEKLRDTTNLEA